MNQSVAGFLALPVGLDPAKAIYDFTIPANKPWTGVVRRGQILRIVDLEGQQAVDTLFYSLADTSERYSAQDTILEQGAPYVTTGTRLISNIGNVMATVVADTSGRHDTSAGACSCEANTVRFGHHTRTMHACRENFIIAIAAHGMTKRDIVPNINFFMNVPVTPERGLTFADGISAAGRYVELEALRDVRVLISNCPQLNNPCNAYNPTPVRVSIRNGA